jgi:hypothetical protein
MRPPPYCRQGSCCLSAQQPRYAGQLLGRTYAQRAGDRMLAPSRLSWRGRCAPPRSRSSFASAQLGAASPTGDRYRADTARSAQGRRCSPIVRSSSRKGRNSLCGLLELQDPQCTIGPPSPGAVQAYAVCYSAQRGGPSSILHPASPRLAKSYESQTRDRRKVSDDRPGRVCQTRCFTQLSSQLRAVRPRRAGTPHRFDEARQPSSNHLLRYFGADNSNVSEQKAGGSG